MGASDFLTYGRGKTIKEAFRTAVEEAQYEHGHDGYTGTIAEKGSYLEVTVPKGLSPESFAQQLIDDDGSFVHDSWGPAGAVRVPDKDHGEFRCWLFFGWAPS